jgi:ferric-dicitrate binding protein FerR (iron transport regulator)
MRLWRRRGGDLDPALIDRLLAGDASADDAATAAAWAGTDARRAWVIELLQGNAAGAAEEGSARVEGGGDSPFKWGSAPIQAVLARRRGVRLAADAPAALAALAVISPIRQPRIRRPFLVIAGLVLLCVATLGAAIEWALPMFETGALFPAREYRTSGGQRETVLLPDGSQFTLAPSSRLRLSLLYGRRRREVTLDGEGLFTVVSDPDQPFVVRAANAELSAVGGEAAGFDVRSFPGDSVVTIAVVDGHVALPSISLAPGDLATVSGSNTIVVAPHADVATWTGWTAGRLEFRGVPLASVLVDLSRWYDLSLRVTDSTLAHQPVTASYDNLAASDAISSLAASVRAELVHQGRVTTFVPAPED